MLLRRACSTPIFRRVFARAASSGVPPSPTARHGALLAAIRQIEAAHGKGSLMQLGQTAVSAVDVIPTGSLALDTALGIGGLPRGRIVEIYGAESSGKTTVALQVVAEAQRMGLTCFFCDAEHAIDPAYARALGINLDALYLSQPDTGEQALEIVDTMVRSGGVDVVVVDSVAALVPKAELEGEMGDSHMALQARLMSQALRKLTASLSKSHCLIIFINQIRSKVGVVFGSPDVTTGGNALKFYASVRLEIKRTGTVKGKGEGEVVANLIRVKVAKNKLAPPFRVADFEMTYGQGVSKAAEVVDLGVACGALARSGAWYTFATPEAVAAVNAGLGGGGGEGGAGEGEAAAGAAGGKAAGKRGKQPQQQQSGAAGATAPVPPAAAAVDAVQLAQPFAQGRDKAKAWFEARPAALAALGKVVKAALKAGATPGAAPGATTAVGTLAQPLPGALEEAEEEGVFGEAAPAPA